MEQRPGMRTTVVRALAGVLAGIAFVLLPAVPAGAGDSASQGVSVRVYGPGEAPTTTTTVAPEPGGSTQVVPATGVTTNPGFTG